MRKTPFLLVLVAVLACASFYSSCNSAGNGMDKTENGFQYNHYIKNSGANPQVGEYAYFNYTLYVDDSLIETSQSRGFMPKMQIPDPAQLKNNPSPVVDGLKLMAVNDSLSVFLPLDSMDKRPPQFANNDNLIYHIKLEAIKDQAAYDADIAAEKAAQQAKTAALRTKESEIATIVAATLSDYNSGMLNEQLQKTASGLKYIVHEEGNGLIPKQGERIKVHYFGVLTSDGTMFDNSFKRGSPYPVALGTGAVIAGWDEGLALLKKGTKATLFIPAALGYGDKGSPPVIPPKAELQFYVEIEE